MRIHLVIMLFLGAVFIVSCGSASKVVNKRINSGALAAIRKGATTKEQVRALLGAPQSERTQLPVRQPTGVSSLPAKYTASEIWAFWTDINSGPAFHLPFTAPRPPGKAPCTVIVYIDERGTVLDYETSGEIPDYTELQSK